MALMRLGDMLVASGTITERQLQQALAAQKKTRTRLGDTLMSEGILTERQLIDALTIQLGIDYIDLNDYEIDPRMTKYVPKQMAERYQVVPVKVQGSDLYLAMVDPLNFNALEEVRVAAKKQVISMISTKRGIERAISVLYGTEGAKRAIREMQRDGGYRSRDHGGLKAEELETDESQAPSVRLVNNIIERGISDRASDIHIEPQEENMVVRMRVDGLLHKQFDIPKELQDSLISRVKVMCNMDVTNHRTPQDGRAMVRVRETEVDLRVSTLPTVHGEKIVMRLLSRDNKLRTAEQLGFAGHNLELYNELLANNQGIVLLVGPTGSGKSSTLFTMVSKLNTEEVNIVTLEDPVEYNIVGVNQVQVDEKNGTTFASGLRSILRQDPDIITVGEIRDNETADIAMRSAMTGHLVISTLHTNDAISTIDRLDDIGVPRYMIASSLKGVIAQRLVRRICPYCRDQYRPTSDELEMMGMDPDDPENEDVVVHRGKGCPECFGTGYMGRTVVSEILPVDRAVRAAIHTNAPRAELETAARNAGFRPIMDDYRRLVLSGITTVEEVRRSSFVS